ncbi:MAG: hypothetical protein IJS84_07655 [Spirochaetales bacterium]|nr:hypothetical protein [Spirochaetales bacterium]
MKKALITLILIVSVSMLFAAEGDGLYTGVTDLAYRPTSLDRNRDLNYSLFGNAATLGEGGLRIQFPYLESSSFNIAEALKDRGVAEALSGITKFRFNKDNWITYLLGLVMATGAGYNDAVSADIGLGAQLGHVAFGLNTRMKVSSMPKINEAGELEEPTSALGNGYVPQLDTALTVAYGLRVVDSDLLTLDLGAAVRFAQKVYMLQINAEQISDLISGSKDFETLSARGGFAIPFDLGVTLGLFGERLQVQASADNLNGIYYMKNYQNSKNALMFKDGNDQYKFYTPFSLELGVLYTPKFRIVNPEVSLFFTGINRYIEEAGSLSAPGREIFRYLDAGLELDVVDIVRFRASYRYGYPEFAVGVNAFGNLVELSYGYHEAGREYGLKPVDKLTVRFRLGFEK